MQEAEQACRRGTAYWIKGQLDRAIADYTQAIRLDPEYAEAYHNRGLAYAARGDAPQAEADQAKYRELLAARKR
jgi:tetratricopeptide (TPR) repeat protein